MILNAKKPHISMRFFLNLILALSAFPGRLQPSIIDVLDFTTVFEMGTGVSPKLYAPEIFNNFFLGCFEIFVNVFINNYTSLPNFLKLAKTFDLLVLVS